MAGGWSGRAAACDGRGGVEVVPIEVPPPGPGEVVLEVACAGLCGTDLFKLGARSVPSGTVLGHEISGRVVAIGSGTGGIEVGDRVVVPHHLACQRCPLCLADLEPHCPDFAENLLSPGGFSSHIRVAARAAAGAAQKLPTAMPDEVAVFLEPAACVLRAVRRSGLLELVASEPEAPVAILGAGSMGLLHLLVIRSLLPQLPVTVVEPLAERRDFASSLGADVAEPAGPSLQSAFPVLFDTVGAAPVVAASLSYLRPGGVLVLFAHAGPGETVAFDLNPFFKQELRLVASYSSGIADQQRVFGLLESGLLDPSPLVTHRLALEQLPEAVSLARSRDALKVLLFPFR